MSPRLPRPRLAGVRCLARRPGRAGPRRRAAQPSARRRGAWALGMACLLAVIPARARGTAATSEATAPAPAAAAAAPQVPYARCSVQDARGHTLALHRRGPSWPGWPRLCEQLAAYLALPPEPIDAATTVQATANLAALGYFDDIRCRPGGVGDANACATIDTLWCQMAPAPLVKSVALRGRLPLTLLQQDLRRHLFMRPGTRVHDRVAEMGRQKERLRAFLVGEGYIDATVEIGVREVDGIEPNIGLHLNIGYATGAGATLGDVVVRHTGAHDARAAAALTAMFRHSWLRGWPMRFRPAAFNADLVAANAYLRQAGWPAARVDGHYTYDAAAHVANVALQADLGPRVQISFVGNAALADAALRKLATFAREGAVDSVAIDAMRQNIVHRYQRQGYPDVQVQAHRRRDDAAWLTLIFHIDEGQRLPLRHVEVAGIGPAHIKKLLAQAPPLSRASGRVRQRFWVDTDVARDERELQQALRRDGYAQAQVRAQRRAVGEGRGVDLVFLVNAGLQRLVGRCDVVDEHGAALPLELVQEAMLQLRPGAAFVPAAVDEDAQGLQAHLAAHGYMEAQVQAQTIEAPEAATAADAAAGPSGQTHAGLRIVHRVRLGTQARLGGLFIRGNWRTTQGLLSQELKARPGDPLDLAALGAARRRLRASTVFNTVQLTPLVPQPQDPTAWLLLDLEERDVRTLDGVTSYSSDYRFSLGADYRDRNLFGRAMVLVLQLRLSNASAYLGPDLRIGNQDWVNVTLRAPRPLGLPVDTEAQLLYRYQDVLEYRERRVGGIGQLARQLLSRERCRLCPTVTGKLGYELTYAYRADKVGTTQAELNRTANVTIARLIASINVNRRDSAVDPTRGYGLDIRLEGAHPSLAGAFHADATAFWRAMYGVQGFWPLGVPLRIDWGEHHQFGGPLVVAATTQLSLAGAWTARGAVPPSETFGYGGDFSVRGLINRASTQQLDNAHNMIVASLELRWNVWPNLGFGDLQLAGFVDAGSVAARPTQLFAQMALTAGPALRYVTPIGPLSLAYGRALALPPALKTAPLAAPPSGRVHLTFGYTF